MLKDYQLVIQWRKISLNRRDPQFDEYFPTYHQWEWPKGLKPKWSIRYGVLRWMVNREIDVDKSGLLFCVQSW